MNEADFRNLVAKMRKHQRGWYKDHLHVDLVEAKQLEKQVDREIEKGPDAPTAPIMTTEAYQEHLRVLNELELESKLDFPDGVRPTDGKGENE